MQDIITLLDLVHRLQEAGHLMADANTRGVPGALDAGLHVDKARRLVRGAARILARAAWAAEVEAEIDAYGCALDPADDEPDVIPIRRTRRASGPRTRRNGHA